MNNPETKSNRMTQMGLRAIKVYICAALPVWKLTGFYIAGPSGLFASFAESPLSLAIGAGYVLGVAMLLAHAFAQFKSKRAEGLAQSLVFAGFGLLCLLLGADLSSDTLSSVVPVVALGMSGLMVYYSWKGMRFFKSRALLFWFWGYAISLGFEIAMRLCHEAAPPLPGATGHAGWFWNLLQNAGFRSLRAEWFLHLYWLGHIVSSVLIAAGMILLVRAPGPEGAQPVPVNTAKYVGLGVLLMLIGIYPSLQFFGSPGFVAACAANAVMLAYAVSGFRRAKNPCFALWAWACGVSLLLAAGSQFHRSWEYPPRDSDRFIIGLMGVGGLVSGFLWVAGLMLALRQPLEVKPPDAAKTGAIPKVALLPRPPSGRKGRLAAVIGLGGVAVGVVWLSQNDPSEVFSREPKYEGHTLSYWLGHWQDYPQRDGANVEARTALQSMGAKAVPKLVKLVGARSDDAARALVCIGAAAAPALGNKLVETLADTNPPSMNWRRAGNGNSTWRVQACAIETLNEIGTNAEAALPALIAAVRSSNWWTQAEAATALANVGRNQPDIVIHVLVNVFQNPAGSGMAQGEVAAALGSIGESRPETVIPALIGILTNRNTEAATQAAVAGALASVGRDQPDLIVPVLISVFTNLSLNAGGAPGESPDFMRWEFMQWQTPFPMVDYPRVGPGAGIADALATFGSGARLAIPHLVLAGQSTNADLRSHVAIAIQKISPETPDALAPLTRNLTEKDANIREQALWTLQSLGSNAAEALPALTQLCLHDPVAQVRTGAMDCIGKIGKCDDAAMKAIGENAASPNGQVAQSAVSTLAGFAGGSKLALVELAKARSASPVKEVREAANLNLGLLLRSNPASLAACLEDTNSEIRIEGLRVVDQFGPILPELPQTIPALQKALHDDNPEARAFATNLLIQVESGNYGRQVAELLVRGGDVNATNAEGQTALHTQFLSPGGHQMAAISALLEAGANPNAKDKLGRTPAHLLLSGTWPWRGVGEKLSLLVNHGADLSAADNNGRRPLHYLADLGGGNPLIVIGGIGDTFVAAKVDINARDQAGDTPLHLAARTGTRDVFDWLVKQGADLDATNNAGETPRQLAANLPPTPRAPMPSDAASNGQLAPRVDPRTGRLVYTDHWGDTPVRDVDPKSKINYLGTTLALDPNGTNLELRLLTAIFDSSAKEFPDDNGFNFSVQVRSSTNESSPKNILGQVESGVTFGSPGDQFPRVRTTQLDCEKVGGGRSLFLYEIAIEIPLRQKLSEVPESISLITSAASELVFFNYVRQIHPDAPSAYPTPPPANPNNSSTTNARSPQAQPQAKPANSTAATAGASTSRPLVVLSIQKEPGYVLITCSPKVEGSRLETADLNVSPMQWRPVLTGTNDSSNGWYIPSQDGARAFRVKLDASLQ